MGAPNEFTAWLFDHNPDSLPGSPHQGERTGCYLERQRFAGVRDMDNSCLALESADETGLAEVLGSSITYRIAVGPHRGRKAFSPQTLPAQGGLDESGTRVANVAGFSLHAGLAVARHE